MPSLLRRRVLVGPLVLHPHALEVHELAHADAAELAAVAGLLLYN